MSRFVDFVTEELKSLDRIGLLRTLDKIDTGCYSYIKIGGKKYINFCSNNYLSLNGHPYIAKAMVEAIDSWGTSSSSSRLIVGDLNIFEEAEEKLAKFKGKESSLIFSSGYQANVSVISTLASYETEIYSDELNHASIIDGCKLSKSKVKIYRHKDMNQLEDLLKLGKSAIKIVVTDGVFSMDGDIAPLDEMLSLLERYDAVAVVDDAHATGILGENGGGTLEHFNISDERFMVLGTGGKAMGVGGAFFCCSKTIRDYLINKSRGFIYSTAPVPSIPAGLIAAVDIIYSEPERRNRLKDLADYFHEQIKLLGVKTSDTASHIIPVIIGDNEKTLNIASLLLQNGIFVKAIRKPTVPAGTERIRFSLIADHSRADVDKVIEILKRYL